MSEDKFIKVSFRWLGAMPFQEACFLAYLDNECRLHSGKVKVKQVEVCKTLNLGERQYERYLDELTEAGYIIVSRCRDGKYISMDKESTKRPIKIGQNVLSRKDKTPYHDRAKCTNMKGQNVLSDTIIKEFNKERVKKRAYARESPLYSGDGILEAWTEHYKAAFGTDYIPDWSSNASDTVTLDKAVEKKMEQYHENYSDLEAKKDFCRRMFDAMLKVADAWQRDHWSLHTVTTQFNQLFNTIINGKATTNNGTRNASTDTEYIKRVMREAGLPVADPCGM